MDSNWFEQVPKVELHVHLEGAIPLETLWQLVQKYGGDPAVPDLAALEEKFRFRDFLHFIETWMWKNRFLKEYEDFTLIAEAVARDLHSQNVRYAEVMFTPSDFAGEGLETQKIAEAVRAGYSRVPEIKLSMITDVVRHRAPENAARNLAEINEVKDLGIIGITIGGMEDGYPPEPFADVYEQARQLGFHTAAHAGEAAGPESVWGAIRSLKVERIGHGTNAVKDEALVDYLAANRIPVEINLISNVRTRVVDSIEQHPVRRYFDRGIPLSINTDDPKMFDTSLAEEYEALERVFGFTRDEIRKTILQGIETSWLSGDEKLQLAQQFRDSPGW